MHYFSSDCKKRSGNHAHGVELKVQIKEAQMLTLPSFALLTQVGHSENMRRLKTWQFVYFSKHMQLYKVIEIKKDLNKN